MTQKSSKSRLTSTSAQRSARKHNKRKISKSHSTLYTTGWTNSEEKALIKAVEIYGRNWQQVVSSLMQQGVSKKYQTIVGKAISISKNKKSGINGLRTELF